MQLATASLKPAPAAMAVVARPVAAAAGCAGRLSHNRLKPSDAVLQLKAAAPPVSLPGNSARTRVAASRAASTTCSAGLLVPSPGKGTTLARWYAMRVGTQSY